MSDKKLGRGLGAIFGDGISDVLEEIQQGAQDIDSGKKTTILLNEIVSNPYQPRKIFDEEKIAELATSIKQHGVFTPILVRKALSGYELVAGERRVLASREVGLESIPAIIVDFDDDLMLEIGLLENIQREDLNVIEEANAYQQMLENFDITQNELAKRVGKTREHIANITRLLRLPKEVQQMVIDKKLSMGHVRPLITLKSDEEIIYYANEIVDKNLSVRAVENLMRKDKEEKPKEVQKVDYQLLDVEKSIESKLQTKVTLSDKRLVISYSSVSDLNRILQILNLIEES